MNKHTYIVYNIFENNIDNTYKDLMLFSVQIPTFSLVYKTVYSLQSLIKHENFNYFI